MLEGPLSPKARPGARAALLSALSTTYVARTSRFGLENIKTELIKKGLDILSEQILLQ